MFRTLFQLAILAGGMGWAVSHIDSATLREVEDALRDVAGIAKTSGVPGGKEAAKAVEEAAVSIQDARADEAKPEKQDGPPLGLHVNAFHNKLPEECTWEKIIDPADGRVRCSVPERTASRTAGTVQGH